MKKSLVCSVVMLFLLMLSGSAHAALVTIGAATYNGSDYNLIWDDDNNGNSVIWLDYTNDHPVWKDQTTWAAGLNTAGVLTYNTPGYTVDFGANPWRLPSTVDGIYQFGYDGTTTGGYNITSSEMGHLYYTELGNKGYYATDGTNPQPGWGLVNTGDFENLIASWYYWSGTEYADNPGLAWHFGMIYGIQGSHHKSCNNYGLAVRSGQVSAVPVPGALWLLGSGLIGLVGVARMRDRG